LSAAAQVHMSVRQDDSDLVVDVSVRNVGAGHALPTGEPMRSMILQVEESCDGESMGAVGGSAVPDFGGHLASKISGEDWTRWPGAEVGNVLRVVRRTGAWLECSGYGPSVMDR
jgi:hypothetical protein